MRIAFDLRRIRNPGIGRYMKCLVEAILKQQTEHDYLLLLPPDADDVISARSVRTTRVVPRSRYYSVSEQIELPRILRKHKVDLLHSPHFLLPVSRPCRAVVTIHDVIYLACPRDLPSSRGKLYYSAMMRTSARLATRIITDSVFSKEEIVRYLHVDPAKISVIYPAVDAGLAPISDPGFLQAVLSRHGIDNDFIFYTGIYKPRKNHAGLMRALQYFLARGGDAQLVIAGPLGDGERELRNLAEDLRIAKRIIFTGYIEDSELCALYTAARVYACPSLYEGFGFTVLEAMACGTPVVCSNTAALPEVAGDAALYADANNTQAFGEALYRACTDEIVRRDLTDRGYNNLQRFSWEQAANSCLQTYDETTAMRRTHAVAFT
jgi:glycosyltransferase involved in cell wall biosynthesis